MKVKPGFAIAGIILAAVGFLDAFVYHSGLGPIATLISLILLAISIS